ncbi:hypothetical protein ACWD5R_31465 [Streptomyces sp. NPDC002514]|uniref:hypothetical protein n=1 Tax=unclassified Streptomyces TaxID=2593676 RepID=UPI0036D0895E
MFGRKERVGFHDAFAARGGHGTFGHSRPATVEFRRDSDAGGIHGLRGQGSASLQLHPESVRTEDGLSRAGGLLTEVPATWVS